MTALALAVKRTDARIPPDHAGTFDTTLLSASWPERVHLGRLPSRDEVPSDQPDEQGSWDHRHTPGHPLQGIIGPDPRGADLTQAGALLDDITTWVCEHVNRSLPTDTTTTADSS